MKLPSRPTTHPIPSPARCRIIKAGLEAWIRANPKETRVVGGVREELESGGGIRQLEKLEGKEQ
jgi:hypothetical protein